MVARGLYAELSNKGPKLSPAAAAATTIAAA